ncbi:hypothetical protein OAV88_03815 [bacterium]|nr:hypothetical protein [bacterium]
MMMAIDVSAINTVESRRLNLVLFVWCMFVYAVIHYRRLDASHDRTFLGFGFGKQNESSRTHTFLGAVSGYCCHYTGYSMAGGIGLLILYSLRNFKHEPRLDPILRPNRQRPRPFPPIWRNSMCRQQMQFHAGLGLGSFLASYATSSFTTTSRSSSPSSALSMAILVVSVVWGLFHISLQPWKGHRTHCA